MSFSLNSSFSCIQLITRKKKSLSSSPRWQSVRGTWSTIARSNSGKSVITQDLVHSFQVNAIKSSLPRQTFIFLKLLSSWWTSWINSGQLHLNWLISTSVLFHVCPLVLSKYFHFRVSDKFFPLLHPFNLLHNLPSTLNLSSPVQCVLFIAAIM